MSYLPSIPMGGVAGWRFLERTAPKQQAAFDKSPQVAREIAFFKENIGKVTSAEQLVADRRLLKVALGAFGLEGEIDKKAFVRKILEGGTDDPRSYANRLTNPAFKQLAEAFGFGNAGGPKVAKDGFADKIAAQYRIRQFEVAVGEVNDDMRLALTFRREIGELAKAEGEGPWFQILGSKPLRRVMEMAFGLPKEFAKVDIDRQAETLRDRTRTMFGEGGLAVFKDPANVEKLINRFLARSQIETGLSMTAPGSGALTLLQNITGTGPGSSDGLINLLAARR
jgi:hypothetical protein